MAEVPYWETQDYKIHNSSMREKQEALRVELLTKMASIRMAMILDLTEAEIETLVDDLWNDLRAMAMSRYTVDLVLGILMDFFAQDVEDEASKIQDEIARIPVDWSYDNVE